MPIRLSRYFSVDPPELKARGVFDGHLGIDNKLFVDPKLLKKKLRIPEFSGARKDITKYFSQVIKLLKASKQQDDVAWLEAEKRMRFKEENGASLGYGKAGSYGRAVGPQLARVMVKRAKEILALGIDDPELFELIGLFQEDVGADLLSDMAVSILKPRFLRFTQRVTMELTLRPSKSFSIDGERWTLPLSPDGKRALILVPKTFLSKLPIALDRSEIDEVAQFNAGVRRQWNAMVAAARKDDAEPAKEQIREMLFADRKNLGDLIRVYRESLVKGYDFEKDTDGLLSWDSIGRSSAKANPLDISLTHPTNLSDLRTVVDLILKKFNELKTLFPDHVAVTFSRRGKRSILRIDDTFMVSILFCRREKTESAFYWALQPLPAERDCITLICLLNRRYDGVLHYHVIRKTGNWKHRSIYLNSPLLRETVKLERLSDFYVTVKRIWQERSSPEPEVVVLTPSQPTSLRL